VVDVVGGADLLHSVASLRYGGRIALLGLLDRKDEPVSLTQPLLYGGKTSKLSVILRSCPSFDFHGLTQ
jgi:NADPH:quinone reductase-like Zn-dependent oxidoreductase